MKLSEKALQIEPSSTLAITAEAKRLKAEGQDIVGFTGGEPDFDTPEHIKDAAKKALDSGFTKYTPSAGTLELRKAICKKLKDDNGLNYEPNQIVVSNGAKHSLMNSLMAIINPGDEVIIPAPFWISYYAMVKLADGVPVVVQTSESENFKITRELFEKNITDKTKAIMINSPSNPTGMVYSREELEMIADVCVANDLIVISDEIYEKLIYDEGVEHVSIASLNDEIYKRTIVINGMSKSYSMTGWRVGYLAAAPEIAKLADNMQSHMTSNPNSIAQVAAQVGIESSQESVEAMRVQFAIRRDYIYDRVKNIKLLDAMKPQGAFYIFVNVSKLYGKEVKGVKINSAADVGEVLIKYYGVAVVPCKDFFAPDYIRLSFALSLENIEKGMDRIENFVNENY